MKPDFFTDEKLAECTIPARLLFIGLWVFADDKGRMSYSPKRLKMQVFPGDDGVDAIELLSELERIGSVFRYTVQGETYLQIKNFNKHQKVSHAQDSKHPAPPDQIHGTFSEDSVNVQLPFTERSVNAPEDSRNAPEDSVNVHGTLRPELNRIELNIKNNISSNGTEPRTIIRNAFAYFCKEAGKTAAYTLTEKRLKMALTRWKEITASVNARVPKALDQTAEAKKILCKAIDGLLEDDFMRNGGYMDWEQIFNSAEKFQKRIERYEHPPKGNKARV